jgi:hypothetical protein
MNVAESDPIPMSPNWVTQTVGLADLISLNRLMGLGHSLLHSSLDNFSSMVLTKVVTL